MKAGGIDLFGETNKYNYTAYEAVKELYEKYNKDASSRFVYNEEEREHFLAIAKGLKQALKDLERLEEIEKKIMDLLCK